MKPCSRVQCHNSRGMPVHQNTIGKTRSTVSLPHHPSYSQQFSERQVVCVAAVSRCRGPLPAAPSEAHSSCSAVPAACSAPLQCRTSRLQSSAVQRSAGRLQYSARRLQCSAVQRSAGRQQCSSVQWRPPDVKCSANCLQRLAAAPCLHNCWFGLRICQPPGSQ